MRTSDILVPGKANLDVLGDSRQYKRKVSRSAF